jgi:apolipoprotein N-acyltransferase
MAAVHRIIKDKNVSSGHHRYQFDQLRSWCGQRWPWWLTALAICVTGGFFLLAVPPLNLWPLIFVVLVPMSMAALSSRRRWHALVLTWIVWFVVWLILNRWIGDVTGPGYPLLCAYLALYPLIYVWLFRRVARSTTFAKLPLALIAAILWTGIDFVRGNIIFSGDPFYLLAHPTLPWASFGQSADLFGAYFSSFLVAFVSGGLIDLGVAWGPLDRYQAPDSQGPPRRSRFVGCWGFALAIVIIVVNWGYGSYRLGQKAQLEAGPAALVIQTNLPQNNKIFRSPDQELVDVDDIIQLTLKAATDLNEQEQAIDLVLWPETMLPAGGLEPETAAWLADQGYYPGTYYLELAQALQQRLDCPLLLGSSAYLGMKFEGEYLRPSEEYNAVYLVTGEPPYARYDKQLLTPFGETIPYLDQWPWLEEQVLSLGAPGLRLTLEAGKNQKPLTMPQEESLRVATPICFEATNARLTRQLVNQDPDHPAQLIANLSNDGWFGDDVGGRQAHVQAIRFRAIENRTPIIRAVNTGLSVWLDSNGVIRGTVGAGRYGQAQRAGWLWAPVELDARKPFYALVGDIWGWFCLVAVVVVLVWLMLERTRRSPTCTGKSSH